MKIENGSAVARAMVVTLSVVLAAPALAAVPAEYPSGHGALQRWDASGIALTPTWVKIWLAFLGAAFLSSLFFVRRNVPARWVIIFFVASLFVTPAVFRLLGLPFLSGSIAIGHLVFWTMPLIILLKERAFMSAEYGNAYRIWSAAVTFAILFSFVFDIRDAAIYIAHFSG
jgi:hypothetical protein